MSGRDGNRGESPFIERVFRQQLENDFVSGAIDRHQPRTGSVASLSFWSRHRMARLAVPVAAAAVIVQDHAVNSQLLGTASEILGDPQRLSEMRRSASARSRLDAAERIAEVLWEVRRD